MLNSDRIAGNFQQLKGKFKEMWGKLTDDDIALYNGKRDQFLGKIQEHYGLAKDEVEKQIHKFESEYEDSSKSANDTGINNQAASRKAAL